MPTEGHSIISSRPDAKTHVLLRSVTDGRRTYRWQGESRLHASQADAYDAAGLPPDQAPPEPDEP